jgi:hypothetical protein
MAIRCLFFTPNDVVPCQVLRALGAPAMLSSTQRQLESRHCGSGAFIGCPIFMRIEQGLLEANRLRSKAVVPGAQLRCASPC